MSHVTTRDDTKLNVKDWGSGRPVILLNRAHSLASLLKLFFGEGLLSKPVSDEVMEWARDVRLSGA